VEAHQLLLDKIACCAVSDFGGTHAAIRLMITCSVRRYGFLLHILRPDIYRPYLVARDRAVRIAVFSIFGVSHNVQVLDQLNCAKRQLSLPSEMGGLNVPQARRRTCSLCFIHGDPRANMIVDYESESLSHMYGLIR
jgi:hypothetical protein